MREPRSARARATRVALATGLLALFLLAWQGVASLPSVDDLTLASPVETFQALRDDWSLLMDNAGVTLLEVVLGLAISTVAGVSFAVAMHMFRPLRDAAYPLLVASQAIPVVVLAPIFVLAFDYGIGPKLAIVALICFFPITVNLLDGLRSVEPELLKLMRSMGASRLRTLRSAELPSALPFLFSGLKVAATVSVIGAVFGEWAGADEGLGRLVLLGNNQLQTPRVYAGIVLLTVMAVALFALVTLVERLACPWNRKEQPV
jgi:putative hydroxymethylpyrimidine transport system permease protein